MPNKLKLGKAVCSEAVVAMEQWCASKHWSGSGHWFVSRHWSGLEASVCLLTRLQVAESVRHFHRLTRSCHVCVTLRSSLRRPLRLPPSTEREEMLCGMLCSSAVAHGDSQGCRRSQAKLQLCTLPDLLCEPSMGCTSLARAGASTSVGGGQSHGSRRYSDKFPNFRASHYSRRCLDEVSELPDKHVCSNGVFKERYGFLGLSDAHGNWVTGCP